MPDQPPAVRIGVVVDDQTRAVLVQLGWTPPVDDAERTATTRQRSQRETRSVWGLRWPDGEIAGEAWNARFAYEFAGALTAAGHSVEVVTRTVTDWTDA